MLLLLYQLSKGSTGIKELSREKASLAVNRVGNNLIFDCHTNEQQTVVMSTMDGRVVRSLTAKQGSNTISLEGLIGGVYSVTLYSHSRPVMSSKIVIK